LTRAVFALPPYDQRSDRDTTNATDTIFANGGANSLLDLVADGDGYRASVCLALDDGR
jgi:hypothetical protein